MITFNLTRFKLVQSAKLLFYAFAAISCLLSAVTLDLSQYAMDVGKAIASKVLIDTQLRA